MILKKEIYFSYKTFVSYICWKGDFFFKNAVYQDGIKNIFYDIWRVFQMAKIKDTNSNF